MQKGQEYLRFGQIIRIHGHKCLQNQPNKQDDPNQIGESVRFKTKQPEVQIRGMIAVKGFTDKDAKYLTFDHFKNCEFYRQTLFQILPRGYFQKCDNAEQQNKKKKLYEQLCQQRMGQFVKFGEDVVFRHVDSLDYLSGSVRCSDGGLGAFRVQLSEKLLINLVFKLYPFRSFEKQGDKIKLESPLRIKNIENRCYFSTQKNQNKYSIVTTYSQSFTWLIHLHQLHQTLSDTDQIRTHDILFLRHTKNDGYLCLDKKRNQQGKVEVVPCVKLPLQQTGYHCFTCLWEIQKFSVPKISPYFESDKNHLGTESTYSLRELLTGSYLQITKVKQSKQGGSVHLINNLEESNYQITIKSAKGLPNVSDYLKHNGLVKIGGPKSQREDQIDAAQQIQTASDVLKYRQQSPYRVNQVKKSEAQSEHGFRIIKIDEQSKRQVLLILSTYQVLDEFAHLLKKDTIQFGKQVKSKKIDMIDLTLQKLIGFIKNCSIKDIELDVLPVKKRQFICMDLQICQKLFDILRQMGIKILEQIYKTSKVENEAFKTTFNRAYYLIWQIIKNNPITKLYVCESWLDIILDHAIQNEEQRVHQTLNQILQSNELVVTKFLKANNNHLVQRIIDIFTLKPPHQKFLNIFRASCMSNGAPIVGNQKLILNLFFKMLDDVSKFKFLTSINKDRHGQLPIGEIHQDQPNELNIEPHIEKIFIECYISKDHLQRRTLKDFFEDSSRLDLSQTSNYFIAYLNLLADICYGRNTEAKKYVEQILVPSNAVGMGEEGEGDILLTSLDTLIGILQDEQIKLVKGSNNLLRAVIRLINYAYVVSADQNPVLRINRYRNLDNMQKQKVTVGPKFKKVMKFIKDKLSNFESFFSIIINENDPDKKQKQIISLQQKDLMLTVLQLLKSSLVIGYWTVKEQQNQLFPLLLKILSNQKKDILHHKENIPGNEQIKEFQKFKNQVSQSTLSVELIKNCKALACQLIEIIFDFRHDNLVTECVLFYKQKGSQQQRSILQQPGGSIELNLANTTSNIQVHPLYNPQLWKAKMQQIFKQPTDQESRQVRQATKNMNPLMVQLSIHKDPILFFRSLKIMKRHFEYRNDIMKLFLSLSIYDNDNGVELAHEINQKRKILGKLQEENLLYSSQQGVYDDIMAFLVWLSQSIKEGANLSLRPNFRYYVNIFNHFNEESRINKFHQRLIKNKDLHPIMLNFIGLSKQPIREFKGDARMVLKYVYRFLSLLAKSFSQAKSQMIHMKDKIFNHVMQQCQNITMKHDPDRKHQVDEQLGHLEHDSTDMQLVEHRLNMGEIRQDDVRFLQTRDDCEAISLLAQLFSHNKHIIYNEVLMEQVSIDVSQMVNTAPIENYYKSHLLDFFRTMIYYKDRHIKTNQARILAKLQDSKKKNIYYRYDKANSRDKGLSPEYLEVLIDKWETMNSHLLELKQPGAPYPLQKHEQSTVIILPELTYYITMLNLFADLVQGKHDVNIGKCRQVHRYVDLMKILKNSSICYPLKTHLRHYVNELYYSTKIEEDLCAQIIREEIPLIIEDLNTLIVILVKQRQGKYKIAHPIRFKYYDTYIYLYIEQIVYSLNYLQSDPIFLGILMKQLKDDFANGFFYLHYYIMRIYERLRWLLNYFYGHKYIRGFLNKVTNQMKNVFLKDFQKTMFKTFDRNQQKMHDPADYKAGQKRQKKQLNLNREQALKKRSKDLLYKLVKAEIKEYFTVKRPQKDKNFPLTFVLPYGDEAQNPQENLLENVSSKEDDLSLLAQKLRILFLSKQASKQRKDYHHLKLKKLEDSLLTNPQFKVFMTYFKASQCIQLYKIDQFSNSHYGFSQKFVSLEEYIKNFVKVNTQEPDSISNDLKIFFFEVLLEYITQHKHKDLQKSVQEWQKDDWQESKQRIIEAQLFLSGADVAGLIIENLKSSDDIYLSAHVLLFGIAYLIGGNQTCQNSILQKLKEDIKNDVFIKIEKLISRLGKKITTRIAEKTSHKQPYEGEFVVQALDEYDYYDQKVKAMKRSVMVQKTSKDEQQEQSIERAVFSRLFKFLQLLCECNNYELKHFVRVQTNTDHSKKNYSFNVINMTTFEIRRLFKVMCQEACKVVLPLTDFLNEVVTVPCTQNQISLCETTFFEDLCYMANTFNDIEVRQARKFDEPQSKKRLFQIYQKCVLIILNVLQGNQAKLNKQLLIKLDISFLLFVIKQNLKILKIYTKSDLKQLLYNVEIQQKKVPVQLQNAINVMIVLQKLEDCQGSQKFKEKKTAYLKQYAKKPPSRKYRIGGGQVDAEPEYNLKLNLQELLTALKQEMLMIQVVSSKGYQKIYFPKHPILTKLSGATRDRIMSEVSRSTQRQKIKSLFSFKQDIFTQIQHNFKIQKEKFLFGLMSYQPSTIAKLQDYAFKASYLSLIIWFLTTDIIVEYSEVIYFEPVLVRPILVGLNLVQLFITLAYFSSYKVCTFEIAKFRAKKYQQALEKQQQRLKPKEQKPFGEDKQGLDKQNQGENSNNSGSAINRGLKAVGSWVIDKITSSELFVLIKFDEKFKFVFLYLITSLIGTFYRQQAYLVYIIYFFLENETLSNVFNAIFYNLKQLFSVGLLGVVFVYIFSLICYETYALDIMAEKDPDDACDSIISCIMDLYVSGTIGGSVEEFVFMRFLTDLIYFIFFGLLFGNIVSGIMIDTFAQLRSKREQMNDDKKNKCYICGKDRAELQKANENFDAHIQNKHFLWNYIYYMYCLKEKNLTQFSGLQYEIKECIDKGENDEQYISWIPFSSESGQEHGEKIEELNKMMKDVNSQSSNKINQLKSQSSKGNGQVQASE